MNKKALLRSVIETVTFTKRYALLAKNGKKEKRFRRLPNPRTVLRNGPRVFFLKVNNDANWNIGAIQNWLDIINEMGGVCLFVCDSRHVKNSILHLCSFYSKTPFAFVRSQRRHLNKMGGVLYLGKENWPRVAAAHLTPFLLMEENQIQLAWHIDGDDTRFCLTIDKTIELLRLVEKKALERNVAVCSLDMHNTMFGDRLWTFGVCFVNSAVMVPVSSITSEKDFGWWERYRKVGIACNLDTYFTYLRDEKDLPLATFYPKNVFFQHGAMHVTRWLDQALCYWTDNVLVMPIIDTLFGKAIPHEFPVPSTSIKIDIGIGASALRDDFFRRFLPAQPAEFHALGIGTERSRED